MSRICTYCNRIATDKNMFCLQTDCPQQTHPIFGNGVWVGDLQVVRLLYSTNLANFYEATRDSQPVLLKVAHHDERIDDKNPDQPYFFLTNEAYFLMQINLAYRKRPNPNNPNEPLNMLPTLLPAYANANPMTAYFGLTTVEGRLYRYSVFEWIDGNFLTQKLAQNPQPYYVYASQMMVALMSVVQFLYAHQHLMGGEYAHLNLSPNAVYIRACPDVIWRPVLLDLGFVRPTNMTPSMIYPTVKQMADPNYSHYRLLNDNLVAPIQADVYSLGMMMYTILTGKPYFNQMTLSNDLLRQRAKNAPVQLTILSETTTQDMFELNRFIQEAIQNMPVPNTTPSVYLESYKGKMIHFGALPMIPKEKSIAEWTWQIGLFLIIVALAVTLLAIVVGQLGG